MMRCDSCFRYFAKVGDLFEHIQSSCLSFYKRHPEAWAQILSQMTSGSTEESTKAITSVQASQEQPDHQNMACSSLDQPASSSLAGPINRNKSIPLKCKCEAQFNSLEDFKAHLKVCTPGKEPPFCIMFSAQQTTNGRPLKNLHMTVNDYFYGSLPGKSVKLKKITRRFNCYSCGKTLRNNIRFMSHVRHKIFNEWEKKEKVDARNICQHCYRQYSSPFQLQGHLENVHGSVPAASTCRICELHFSSEKTFLFHMKDEHLHNEAPYVCKVCCYQSSFYSDVVRHFREVHGDTSALMCPFCLMVSYNSNSFLKHVLQHIKKGFGCAHCRLVFNNSKERTTHKQEDHVSRVMEDKQRKYKNLHKCQVYIRVASFQTSQRQQLMQKAPEKFLEKGLKRLNSADATLDGPSPSKKTISAPSIKLPGYLCPLKRRQPVKSVSSTGLTSILEDFNVGDGSSCCSISDSNVEISLSESPEPVQKRRLTEKEKQQLVLECDYHKEMLRNCKKATESGEICQISLPEKPKTTFESLLRVLDRKEPDKDEKTEQVQNFLVTRLIPKPLALPIYEYTGFLKQIENLKQFASKRPNQNLNCDIEMGRILDKVKLECKSGNKCWKNMVKEFGFNLSHGDKLVALYRTAQKYPKLRRLDVAPREIMNQHCAIKKVLEKNEEFWKDNSDHDGFTVDQLQ